MGNSWAVVAAAAVTGGLAIFASFFGPWFRDAVTARSRRRLERREAIRAEIASMIEAYAALLRARDERKTGELSQLHSDATVALTRFSVLLEHGEGNVEAIAKHALDDITNRHVALGQAGLGALQSLLTSWYRGEIKPAAVEDAMSARIDAAAALLRAESGMPKPAPR